jgi:SAM-dependent MidA family methyltransferase
VPFLLALPRAPAARGFARAQARLARLAALWERLSLLEAGAWRGELSARALARLQRLRVEYARRFPRPGDGR